RASSQAVTDELIALAAPGSAVTLPTVASAPSWVAAPRAARIVAAQASIGSRRAESLVVPAWSARPGTDGRQRNVGANRTWRPAAHQQHGHRGDPGHHAERAVVGTAVRHRVQVAAGDHGPGRPGPGRPGPGTGLRDVPPRPQVAVAVGGCPEPSFVSGIEEPATAFRVGRRPGEAPVAAGAGVAADRQQ